MKEDTQDFDVVITGVGLLRVPNVPKEFQAFQGTILHSANWDSSVDVSNKVVGVVGSGSSSIQIISTIASQVKELHCYQRQPPHVLERFQRQYSSTFKLFCKYFPPLMWIIRLCYFLKYEFFHLTFYPDSRFNKFAEGQSKEHREMQIKDEKLMKKLEPGFAYGCKRVLFHNDYYPKLQLSHVTTHREKITEIVGNKIICDDGTTTKLDILVLATGFKASDYLDPLKVVGTCEVEVNDVWKHDKPSSYLGIISHRMPNHFLLLGPNTLLGHNSVLFMAECQVNYIVQAIGKMMTMNIKAIKPRKEIEEKYMKNIENDLKKMIWSTGKCGAWYNDKRGNVTALYPYTCITYWRNTRNVNMKDFELDYK